MMIQILTNHLGYAPKDSKTAIFFAPEKHLFNAQLIDAKTHQAICDLDVQPCGYCEDWLLDDPFHHGHMYQINFSSFCILRKYQIQIKGHPSILDPKTELLGHSHELEIKDNILFKRCASDLVHYFKSQRSSGIWDEADKHAPIFEPDSSQGSEPKTKDVHGGWFDASGDVSKYLSHLSYANYFNPQQIPMLVWVLSNSFQRFEKLMDNPNKKQDTHVFPSFLNQRIQDEACFGADFLLRMQDESGFFYMTVFDKWSKDPTQRELCSYKTQDGHKQNSYQAGFRQGGGMAIAALAEAVCLKTDKATSYWQAAHLGYQHLKENNLKYLDDGKENIIDVYCALMASISLYKAQARSNTDSGYQAEAKQWAHELCDYFHQDESGNNYWLADKSTKRPYFHAAEAGLPCLALLQYSLIFEDSEPYIQDTLALALQAELDVTESVNNPFAYPRQFVRPLHEKTQASFFIPQDNETLYWWQGENARLASLAAVAWEAQKLAIPDALKARLRRYANHNVDWILGRNPFDICMLDGHGYNNPEYLSELGFFNAKGGVCNGITAGFNKASEVAFNPEPYAQDMAQNWRWSEQWLPHGAWLFYALSSQFIQNNQ